MFALDVAGEAGKLNCNIQIWQRTVTLRQGYGIAIVFGAGWLVGWGEDFTNLIFKCPSSLNIEITYDPMLTKLDY